VSELNLGEIFAQKRLELNIDVKSAAQYLLIKRSDIISLEHNNIEELRKQHLYVLGIIRSYGKFLKIDSAIIEEKIKELPAYCNVKNMRHSLINIGEGSRITPTRDVVLHCLIVTILLSLVFLLTYNLSLKSSVISNEELISRIQNLNVKD
jgi:cytoskeletal protein RodZ